MDLTLIFGGTLATAALLSAGLALGLSLLAPRWRAGRRAILAAAVAALLPMSLAFGGFLLDADIDDPQDYALGLLALIVFTVILFAIFCLPPAWLVAKRLGRDDSAPQVEDHAAGDGLPIAG
ncbi:hypothetical protein AEB_P1558 [Altererythrobacter sp. B11]|uniref:hypothetical protein n=1 Tax=Altererythrobacter sp. B11 TaxID=2060312 RepID=UPI000DC7202B|nr:hypothetical protein [Altererythrobacter sp. B11]BBC72426.1 hypothetical protein AEB_P1558 [Altererythrobacter sp. B11]